MSGLSTKLLTVAAAVTLLSCKEEAPQNNILNTPFLGTELSTQMRQQIHEAELISQIETRGYCKIDSSTYLIPGGTKNLASLLRKNCGPSELFVAQAIANFYQDNPNLEITERFELRTQPDGAQYGYIYCNSFVFRVKATAAESTLH